MHSDSDPKTEAIVLHYLTRAREAAQREMEAFNERGLLYSGMCGQKIVDLCLAELRGCLTDLANSYAGREEKQEALSRAANAVFEKVTGSFTKTAGSLLPNKGDSDAAMNRFELSASIFKREAAQHLEYALAERAKQVSPRVEKVIVPLVSGVGGAVIGAILGAVATYRLTCH